MRTPHGSEGPKDSDVDTRAGSGFDMDGCVKAWSTVKPTKAGLPAKEFLEAALALTAILDTMSGMTMVKDQVTHSGPTLSTVAQPQTIQRPHAPGLGLA